MITVKSRPYDGLQTKYNPVYNGLPFVVDSDRKYSSSFRYIAEVYLGDQADALNGTGTKIGELRHNPDVAYDSLGVFDVGQIVENYISFDMSWKARGQSSMFRAWRSYYVAFGEEYSRSSRITDVRNIVGSFPTFTLQGAVIYPTDLSKSSILIQGTSYAAWNKAWKVRFAPSGTYYVTPEGASYVSGVNLTNAYALQGFWVTGISTYIGTDGLTYYKWTTTIDPYMSSGDTFTSWPDTDADQTRFLTGSQWKALSVEKTVVGSAPQWTIKTTIPFQTDISGNTIHIFPANNAVKRNLFNTGNDSAIAWNAAFQYGTELSFKPTPWSFLWEDTTRKFLTRRPRKDIKLCADDYFTMSYLGNKNVTVSYPNNLWSGQSFNMHGLIIEGKSSLIYPPITFTTSTSIANGSTVAAKYTGLTAIKAVGDLTGQWTTGTYLTLVSWRLTSGLWSTNTDTSVRVVFSSYSAGTNTTTIVLTKLYTSSMNANATHPWSLTMTQRIVMGSLGFNLYQTAGTPPTAMSAVYEAGVGPQNLKDFGFSSEWGTTITEYTFAPYGTKSTLTTITTPYQFFSQVGEKWTVKIDCPCSPRYKRYTLVWMNDLGGAEYADFTLRTDITRNISRSQFRRTLRSVQSNKYTYTEGQKGLTTYSTDSEQDMTLRTDWLTQAEIDWILWVYESPEVYIIDRDVVTDFGTVDQVFPVSVLDSEIEVMNKMNFGDQGGLKSLTLKVRRSNPRNIQRGTNLGGGYFYNRS